MSTKLAYLSQGKLFYINGEGANSELITSTFGQEMLDRALRQQQKNEWKAGGTASSALYNRSTLWGVNGGDPHAIPIAITAVSPGTKDGELLYVLSTDAVGGMFVYDTTSKKETRLFHKEGLFLTDLSRNAEMTLCSQRFPNGTANISMCRGTDVQQVTEGDSVDEAPAWVPGKKEFVYQSAGVARNGAGHYVGLGPSAIQRLNLENGDLVTVVESEKYDYMSPRVTAGGDLLYIRRPYETTHKRNYPVSKILLDIVLFPFRLGRAIFDFLNFFSIAFSRKPLTTASGPKVEGPDQKMLQLRGKMIDAEELMKKQERSDEPPALVPNDWQLVLRKADGTETVVAPAVLSYDVDKEGNVIYTNGSAIFRVEQNGSNKKLLCKANVVESLVVI